MSGFDAAWLARREPFDSAARDCDLARRFGAAVGSRDGQPCRIVDLAAGTGANLRALAPHLSGDQEWLLVDHDPRLIAAQAGALSGWARENGWRCEAIDGGVEIDGATGRWRTRALALDLARHLEALDFTACDGVATAAFLDLVSVEWMDRLCGMLGRSRVPLFAALTVDGRRGWQPPLPLDARVGEAFARHQSRNKGFGPALGGRAPAHFARCLAGEGYDAVAAPSDWRIDARDADMLLAMIDEMAAIASETEPAGAADFASWSSKRRDQTRCGLLSLEIGHLDVLAIPRGGRPRS